MRIPQIFVVEHLVSVGAEWVADGTSPTQPHSLLVLKGIDEPSVRFFIGKELICKVSEPERFGPIPTDAASMRRYVERFIANEQEPTDG